MALNLILLQDSPFGSLGAFLPMLLMFGILYFLLILPMQRQKKQTQKMLAALENGNTVLTSGGLVGTVVAVNADDTLIVRLKPDNVKVQVARSAVTNVIPEEKSK